MKTRFYCQRKKETNHLRITLRYFRLIFFISSRVCCLLALKWENVWDILSHKPNGSGYSEGYSFVLKTNKYILSLASKHSKTFKKVGNRTTLQKLYKKKLKWEIFQQKFIFLMWRNRQTWRIHLVSLTLNQKYNEL